MSRNWNELHLKRLLVDMHIPGWNSRFLGEYSPDRMGDRMVLSGTDVAQIAGSSCLGYCFWPTKVGFPHPNLNGRDLLGETLKVYRERGLATQIFLNTWNRAAYEAHPEWRMVFPDGKGSLETDYDNGRFGVCCPNTGYSNFFLELLQEIVPQYETDAYWIDMVGWWNILCQCPACRAGFRKEYSGWELPTEIDWNSPVWNSYVKFREDSLNRFVKQIYNTIKRIAPERSVAFQTGALHAGWNGGGNTLGFYQCGDYLAHDLTGEKFEQIYCSKMYTALSKTHPVEFMVSRCLHLSHHTTERTMAEMSMIAVAAIANQTSFSLIDAIDPAGTLDEVFYHHAREVFNKYAQYEKYIRSNSVPVADCAVYYSQDSQVEVRLKCPVAEGARAASKIPKRFANIARALQEKHILFTFADVNTDLSRFPAVILSDCARMNSQEIAQIQQYVSAGGNLYASADSSLYDPLSGMRPDFALGDLFGVHTKGGQTQKVTYIDPVGESPLNNFCTAASPVMLDGAQTAIETAGGTVNGSLTLPCSLPDEKHRFGSALSNPPWEHTGQPALVRNQYGKGQVIYCAGRLEENEYPLQRDIFAAFVETLSGRILTTNANAWVEMTLFDLPEERRLLLSVLNKPADLPPAPLYHISVQINLHPQYEVKKLLLAPIEEEIPFCKTGDKIEFSLNKVDDFSLIIAEYSMKGGFPGAK